MSHLRNPVARQHPGLLLPFDPRDAMRIGEAAAIAGVTTRTIQLWCPKHGIGRPIAGRLRVSRVALWALLHDDRTALAGYLSGDRTSPTVRRAYAAAGVPLPAPEALAA